MDILLVSISAPPKNSPESLQTGRYLKYLSRNNEVTLLTSDPTGGWEPKDESLKEYLKNTRQVVSLSSLPGKIISLIKKTYPSLLIPDEAVTFLWQYKKATLKIKHKPTVIFSRSAPYSSAVMGMKLARYWKVPWVMHLSDLWVDSPFFRLKDSMRKKQEFLESNCFQHAQIITLTSQKTIEFYKEKYPRIAGKFQFLPNVFDQDDCNALPLDVDGKFRFVFTGRLYGSRSIHQFLHAMEKALESRSELKNRCEVLLAGFFDEENIHRIQQSPLQNVKYLGSLPLNEALQLQKSAHVLISIDSLDSDARYDLFFPSKLLDYMATNRIVIALTNKGSTTYDVIEDKFGKCFYPENIDTLPLFLQKLVEDFAKGSFSSLTMKSMDTTQYEAGINTKRLEKMFLEAISAYG